MRVPAAANVPADIGRKIHGHEFRPGLYEPPRKQTTLAVRRASVALAHFIGLAGNVEGFAQPRRFKHRERLFVIRIHAPRLRRDAEHA